MTIAASYAKLAYYSKPLTAAEAIQKKLVPREVPKCPATLSELATVWGYGSENNIAVKVLKKGLPWAKGASRDSISLLLKQLYKKRPKIIETMVFGTYTHATSIASVQMQQRLSAGDNMIELLGQLSTHSCLALISEFLVAATINYTCILSLVRDVHWWRQFRETSVLISDRCLRPGFLKGDFTCTSTFPSCVKTKQYSFEYDCVWPLLLKGFQINTRLKPETVVAAGEKFELAQSLGKAFVLGAGLIEADLIKLGVPINIVEDVIRSGTAPPNRAMKHMRNEIKRLTDTEHALLKTYIHARHANSFESIAMIIQPPNVYSSNPLFTYCEECKSCRSKFVTSKGVSKRLHGLEVDLSKGAAFCSTCQTKRVQVTCLNSFIFTTRYVNRAIYNLVFCSGCCVLSADVKLIGDKLLCKHCSQKHDKRQVSGACEFCPYPATQQFVGIRRGKVSWISICDTHQGIVPKSWGISVEALTALNDFKAIDSPKRHHGARKRTREPVLCLPRY